MKNKFKKSAKEFKEEFKKSINTGIVAAFGFLIALVWRDLITEVLNKISSNSLVQGKLIAAIIITLICAFGIYISSKIFSPKK
ncbi:MAG: hypothetical protein KJ566_03570 [Nanoarchaeota archaeon]|nr:hypothetical protein [Nanoarchaeota archaeon]